MTENSYLASPQWPSSQALKREAGTLRLTLTIVQIHLYYHHVCARGPTILTNLMHWDTKGYFLNIIYIEVVTIFMNVKITNLIGK